MRRVVIDTVCKNGKIVNIDGKLFYDNFHPNFRYIFPITGVYSLNDDTRQRPCVKCQDDKWYSYDNNARVKVSTKTTGKAWHTKG